MFEGKPPLPGTHSLPESQGVEAEGLRPLRWDELVARLSAARDLHDGISPCDEGGEGSFDADSARRIAAHHHGKPSVNLEGLANFKDAGGTAAQAVRDAGHPVPQSAVRK